ncbi:hypothetical protein HY484_02155 [Candidatus Woesearchaeota archaeon]|nr:hypothetical protein [Candidatus Woesearchaeota archaeon]
MNENVLKEGIAACAALEKVINTLKGNPPVVVQPRMSELTAECSDIVAELEAGSETEYNAMKKALEICCDALDVINKDYQQMTAGLREKLEQYK